MIYEFPSTDEPLRQGDIFIDVPRIEISLNEMLTYTDGAVEAMDWEQIPKASPPLVVTAVKPVLGIVASQDCDLVRARDVTFCEIRRFQEVEKKCKDTKTANSWRKIITQQARLNLKWFYLPIDPALGFTEKMGADFQTVFRVPRLELEQRRGRMRRGRLNDLASAHFRERIAEFFRRYPVDEWYPLDAAEMDAYVDEYPEAVRFGWQTKTD